MVTSYIKVHRDVPLEMVKYMIGRTFLNDIFIVLLCNAKRRIFLVIL